jgi:hypothetical protein
VGSAALLLAASTAYLGVTLTYPLENGSMSWYGDSAVVDHSSATVVYPLTPGTRVPVAISVRNPGSIPVTLDGIFLDTPDLVIDGRTMIAHAASNPSCCLPQQSEPFHPIGVEAHDEAIVFLTLRLTGANRYAPCSSFTVVSAGLRYHVLGMQRSERIALPTGLSFRAPCEST